ncbi:phytoene desaturase family protein [Melghirimyces algeriensis]|uniref:Phytoene dehydrogenase-related protein n=1 Tax=Melghirimyces algeriensis TaxID=910412 RepID=A0A521D823_9BACL|nr:FAD-dependent oxidoreductase [Melghirimyces algeriensis]SMO67848.1 Phytoene dehydrogenase-related protein [Melghirimyces algeriensis]
MKTYEAVIIGGGISGLATSVYLAKAGCSVILLEKSHRVGGRAMTVKKNGTSFNLGAHALFKGGEGFAILRELGVPFQGKSPDTSQSVAIWKNQTIPMPSGLSSLFSTKLLSWQGKWELSRLMLSLNRNDFSSIGPISLREWAETEITDPMVRHLFYALCRTATYARNLDHLLASVVLRQVQRSLKDGVLYVDGGWQSLIEGLREQAVAAGVIIHTRENVVKIEHDGKVQNIFLDGGEKLEAPFLIVTTGWEDTSRMVKNARHTSLWKWKEQARPVFAACLDLGLKRLPNPQHCVAIGLDQPVFFTNASLRTEMRENEAIVVHLIHYLGDEPGEPKANARQLEQTMDLLHPGWRNEVVARQFLPNMVVTQDAPTTDREHPGPSVPEIKGLYIAGDGAGHGEMLVDAALASAKRAALAIIREQRAAGSGGWVDENGSAVRSV